MVIATVFLEFWKRRQAIHQYDWDITPDDDEERVRPEYAIKLKHTRKNPVTQVCGIQFLLKRFFNRFISYTRSNQFFHFISTLLPHVFFALCVMRQVWFLFISFWKSVYVCPCSCCMLAIVCFVGRRTISSFVESNTSLLHINVARCLHGKCSVRPMLMLLFPHTHSILDLSSFAITIVTNYTMMIVASVANNRFYSEQFTFSTFDLTSFATSSVYID